MVVPGLFPARELERWRSRLDDILEGGTARPEGLVVMRDVRVAKGAVVPGSPTHAIARIQDFESDPVPWSYVCHPRLLETVEGFAGPDVASIHTMLIDEPPGVDGRHPLHLHGSGRSRTSHLRRSISAHDASTACPFLDDGLPHGGRPYRLVRGRVHEGGILRPAP